METYKSPVKLKECNGKDIKIEIQIGKLARLDGLIYSGLAGESLF